MHQPNNAFVYWVLLPILAAGCLPTLPNNIAIDPPERSRLYEAGGAVFSSEAGLEDALWIDIPRADGTGTVGGYLSNNDATANELIILLHGASTYNYHGSTGETREFFDVFGLPYRQAGYRTFSLDYQECGSAYGQADVADLIAVIDWLDGGGKTTLGVERVYTLGYSTGATVAILANRQRRIAAAIAISGITEPVQLQQWGWIYALAAGFYPNNEGLCQIDTTLNTYGPPWSPAWDALNTVAHVGELKSPMLVIQGTNDQIFSITNTEDLDAAYQKSILLNASLPPVEFIYLQGQDHFAPPRDTAVSEAILSFFDRFSDVAASD